MRRPGSISDQAIKSLFESPVTTTYPFTRPKFIDRLRGRIVFDSSKCIGCKLCMKDCPSNALNIIKVEEKKFACEYYLDRCIYCSQCVDTCPKDALAATVDFELAQTDSKKLKIFYEAQLGTKPQNVS